MVRKGSQHRNSADHKASKAKSKFPGSVDIPSSENTEIRNKGSPNGDLRAKSPSPSGKSVKKGKLSGTDKNYNLISGDVCEGEKSEDKIPTSMRSDSLSNEMRDANDSTALPESRENNETSPAQYFLSENFTNVPGGLIKENIVNVANYLVKRAKQLEITTLRLLKVANGWAERQRPHIDAFARVISDACDSVWIKIRHAYPIIRTWVSHFIKVLFLLSMVWLDCSLRGLRSLLQLGTTSFVTIIWCSFISILAMIGFAKMLIIMVIAGSLGVFVGLGLAIVIVAISATVILWLYGSFWTTGLVCTLGGISFALSHERIALLLTTVYSIYCAQCYVGWLGLFIGLNLSFFSSDILLNFLRNINEQRANIPPEQPTQSQSRGGHFHGENTHASPSDDAFGSAFGKFADRNSGIPSTSGSETELTSEEEVVRLLNCNDHYSALGFSRYENIDISSLKREYRKKAMLVHPDKNMGNEKAAEAFKKLQNAYEVLLDSLKRKTYDAELRRDEILNYFRRFQNLPQRNGKSDPFGPAFSQSEANDEGLREESRRIACKKCGDFHVWVHTNRSKSRARWCQECRDFHQAKDGDGWVEQSFQPLLFGVLQKMDPPHAYVCADGKVYDATKWFICQGMRCPANSHKPSFHVNTFINSKNNTKGASSSNGGSRGTSINMDETMTEEELFEWLQNAMQSGMFEADSASNESPSARSNSFSKSNSSSGKKKRKGKKQW